MADAHDHFQQHAGEDEAHGQEQQKTDEFMQSGLFGRHGQCNSFFKFSPQVYHRVKAAVKTYVRADSSLSQKRQRQTAAVLTVRLFMMNGQTHRQRQSPQNFQMMYLRWT